VRELISVEFIERLQIAAFNPLCIQCHNVGRLADPENDRLRGERCRRGTRP
jgi:hypothetical protein